MNKIPHVLVTDLNAQNQVFEDLARRQIQTHEIIGEGNYGIAYIGTYQGERVVSKIMKIRDDVSKEDFNREVYVQKRLAGKNLAPKVYHAAYYASKAEGEENYEDDYVVGNIVMEYAGQTLRRFDQYTEQNIGNIAEQMIFVAQQLEEEMICHADTSLSNITVKDGRIMLIDFGFSQIYGPSGARAHSIKTPSGMVRDLPRFVKNYDLSIMMHLLYDLSGQHGLVSLSDTFKNVIEVYNLSPIWHQYAVSGWWNKHILFYTNLRDNLLPHPPYRKQKVRSFGLQLRESDLDIIGGKIDIDFRIKQYRMFFLINGKVGDGRISALIKKFAEADFIYERCLNSVFEAGYELPREETLIMLLYLARIFKIPEIPVDRWRTVAPLRTLSFKN